jgi:chitinase
MPKYPGDDTRGGEKGDGDNLVLLLREMKQAFGSKFGISLTIAPDYWYLRGFKPSAMQQYVDFMGFMSYDLHGPWDADVKTLGSIVRPHTDITEIEKGLTPLWFDGVDPAKVNMGLAFYGRSYKLENPACGSIGCKFRGNGTAGECTNTEGVLSNREIQRMIKEKGYKPYFNKTAMVKYFTYDRDSWIGYDDTETFEMKQAFANSRCLGGLMYWSVDFDANYGGKGLYNGYKSPESATVIPMAHTTVPPKATFTVDAGAGSDILKLPNGGNQNQPQGPAKCSKCSFFRLITSTCCGNGGSVGNPIMIPAGVPFPIDVPLPPGFVPNQDVRAASGERFAAGLPLHVEVSIQRGTKFPLGFLIPAGVVLREGEGDDEFDKSLIWIDPKSTASHILNSLLALC